MALSPLDKHRDVAWNRTRSSSCSSPSRTSQVFCQKMIAVGDGSTLVRSFSCSQFYNKDKNGQTFHSTQIEVSDFITPTKAASKNQPVLWSSAPKQFPTKRNSSEAEPSTTARRSLCFAQQNSIKKSEYCDEVLDSTHEIKPFCRHLLKGLVLCFLFALNLMLYKYFFDTAENSCLKLSNMKTARSKLQTSVFGQSEAVEKIILLLDKYELGQESLTLVFTGPVGVGKTFVASAVYQSFLATVSKPAEHSKFYKKSFSVKSLVIEQQFSSGCGNNLVILDDMPAAEAATADVIEFVKNVSTNFKKGDKILLVLIFRTSSEDQETALLNKLNEEFNQHFNHIPFKPLGRSDVLQCFLSEFKRLSLSMPENQIEKLVSEQMKHVALLNGSPGCKGVPDKVSAFYGSHHHL